MGKEESWTPNKGNLDSKPHFSMILLSDLGPAATNSALSGHAGRETMYATLSSFGEAWGKMK